MAYYLKFLVFEFLLFHEEPIILEKPLRQIVMISNKNCADLISTSNNIFRNQHDEFLQLLFNIASCRTGTKIIKRYCKKIFVNLLKWNCELVVIKSGINPVHILSFLKRTKYNNEIVLSCLKDMISQTENICNMLDNIEWD